MYARVEWPVEGVSYHVFSNEEISSLLVPDMVLILDGWLEISAHACRDLGYYFKTLA